MTARHDSDLPVSEPNVVAGSDAGNPSDEGGAPESGGALRVKYEAALARITELETEKEAETGDLSGRLLAQEFERIGLDPSTGMGKAIAVTFDGEPEHLAEFAQEEFDYTPINPLVPKIASSYAALDGLAGAAGSISPPTKEDEIRNTERRGDPNTTIAMKGQQLGDMLRPA